MFKLAQYFEQLAAFYNLCKLVFTIVFVAHFAGCMFFLVGSYQIQNNLVEKTWIEAAKIENKDWFEQYITSLYWAVITMITIGYGDITPITVYERAFVILITLISCGVFAYSVNQIGIIIFTMYINQNSQQYILLIYHQKSKGVLIQALTQSSNQFKQKMGLLIRHLRHRGVSHNLQMQVRKYFEYWHSSRDDNDGEQCDQMIESLSNNLKKEVQSDIRIRLINQMPILKNNFSPSFLKNIANHIKTKRTKPEEILIEEQQVSDKLYFLVSGALNSYISIKRDDYQPYTAIKLLKPNSIFDQISFMAELPCLTGYRSIGSCTLYYINKEDFIQEIKTFPHDQEKYQLIKDNIVVYRSQRNIGTKCNFCEKYTHSFDRCPYVKYIPYSEKSLIIYRATIEQIRVVHKRRDTTIQTLLNAPYSKERAVHYLIEKNPFQNEEGLIERLELVNYGEDEFNKELNNEYQTIKTNFTVNEEQKTKNKDDYDSEKPDTNQHSIVFQNEAQSPNIRITNPNIFLNKLNTNHDSSLNNQGENTSNYQDGGAGLKNNSNLNTLFSLGDNQQQHQQLNQNHQSIMITTPSQYPNSTNQQAEQLNTDQSQGLDLNNQFHLQHVNLNQNQSVVKKKAKIIPKSPQQKKKQVDLSQVALKQKELLGLVNQSNSNFSNAISTNMVQNFSTNQGSLNQSQKISDFVSKMHKQKTDDYEGKGYDEVSRISSAEQVIGNTILQQNKKKSFNRIVTITEHQNQSSDEISQIGIGGKRIQIGLGSEKRNQTFNNLGIQSQLGFEQEANQIINRRGSTTSKHLSMQQLQNNLHNQITLLQMQQQQLQQQLQNTAQQQQQPHYQLQHSTSMVQKTHFFPLLYFDKMKIFQCYYPAGNYTKILERVEQHYYKRAEQQGKDKNKFKRSVNKIMQINQLQNMILKKAFFPFKTSTPGSAGNKKLTFIQQDSFRQPKTLQMPYRQHSRQHSAFGSQNQQVSPSNVSIN